MFEHDSQYHPTIGQVLAWLGDTDRLFSNGDALHGNCCAPGMLSSTDNSPFTKNSIPDNSSIGHLYASWTESYAFMLLRVLGKNRVVFSGL